MKRRPRRIRAPVGLGLLALSGVLCLRGMPAAAQAAAPASIPANLSGVAHADKARRLSAAARANLTRDGAVVVGGSERHFFALYDRNRYEGIPHFVALDPLLHLFHRKFDSLVMAAEMERGRPALQSFARKQSDRALALLQGPAGSQPAAAAALKWLAIYHTVPRVLLTEPHLPDEPIDPRIAADVEREVKLIKAARGQGTSAVCPHGLTYSRFQPRGHYRGYALQGYFQAMMFYAECGFDVQRPAELGRALDIVRLIQAADPEERQLLTQVSELLGRIAGPPDPGDLEPGSLAGWLDSSLPPLPTAVSPEVLSRLQQRLHAVPAVRLPTFSPGPGAPDGSERSFHLLALGTLPDNVVLQRIGQAETPVPSALDVLAALGSATARELRQPALLPPPPSLAIVPSLAPPRSFYARWLALLAQVTRSPDPGERQPAFMRSPAFRTRLVRSAAGSYAELRHDTLLYVKQPLVMMEGGHEKELPASRAAGYVEPRPDIYRRVGELLREAAALLPSPAAASRPGSRPDSAPELLALLDFLTMVSELELADQPIPKAADDRLRDIGSELEALTRGHADRLPDQALVADILTLAGDGGPERALHIGIGNVDELWVVVPRGGKRLLTRGGVFSYYEFLAAPGERLDDTAWAERLDSGSPPPRPGWTRPLDEDRIKTHRRPLRKQ